jgi:hypothetical protein
LPELLLEEEEELELDDALEEEELELDEEEPDDELDEDDALLELLDDAPQHAAK